MPTNPFFDYLERPPDWLRPELRSMRGTPTRPDPRPGFVLADR
ncbi:hypothetical protein [Acaryochloris sp. 'Moss Beach']|nr:hypothetical protein [Acaryochloris sp. 'Moss Beach']